MVMPLSLPSSAWLEHSSGPLEAAASEPLCSLDGREYHLPLPHHDGGDDASETSPNTAWILWFGYKGGVRERERE